MKLEDVKRELRERGGAIKAFALHWSTIEALVAELGLKGTKLMPDVQGAVPQLVIFEVPIIVLAPGQPEGVIV